MSFELSRRARVLSATKRCHKRYHAATNTEEEINTVLVDMVHFLNKQRNNWGWLAFDKGSIFFSGMVPSAIIPSRSLAEQPAL